MKKKSSFNGGNKVGLKCGYGASRNKARREQEQRTSNKMEEREGG